MLAELKDMPSFVLLMKIMEGFETDVLSELSLCRSNEEIVRIGRFFQCLRSIREFLKNRPEQAAEELSQVKRAFEYGSDLAIPLDVVRQRFNRDYEESSDPVDPVV